MKWLAKLLLTQKFKKLQRKVLTHNLSTANTAVIVYDATKKEDDELVRKFARFLKEEGLKVSSFGFYKLKNKTDVPPKEELNYFYFTTKQLNWLKQLGLNQQQKTLLDQADLLIDLNINEHFCLEELVVLSKANFKVGAAGSYRDQACDLTIKLENAKLAVLIKELKKYLAIINKKIAS
jgi:hypothetical protein